MSIDSSSSPSQEQILILEPGRAEKNYWADLWRYRELFLILAWRDISVRYKQTIIGILWAIIRPFLTMVVFTVIFGRIAKLPSDGSAPYALMVFAAMLHVYPVECGAYSTGALCSLLSDFPVLHSFSAGGCSSTLLKMGIRT